MKEQLRQNSRLSNWRSRLFFYAAILFSFALPFGGHIASPILAIILLVWLFDPAWRMKFQRLKANWLILIPGLLYLFYLLGMFYTDDMNSGYSQLETKLTLLLGPIILGSILFPEQLTKKRIIVAFIGGCFFAMIACLAHAVFCFYDERWKVAQGLLVDTYVNFDFFYASLLSWFIHPSYFAMFLCLCMFYIFSQGIHNTDGYSKTQVRILLFVNVVFSIFIFFLASRLGLGVMLLTWAGVVVYYIIWKKMYLRGILMFAIILLTFVALYKTLPVIASRFDSVIETLSNKQIDKATTESSAARKLIWGVATDVIGENWLKGVGTGDVSKTLLEKYDAGGMTGAKAHNWNAHNQFLQTFMAIGLLGFLALVAMIFLPAYFALRERRYLFLIFLIIFTLNIMVESMLEAEVGVLFFVFFYSVLQRLPVNRIYNS